jgi:hypothetical protein
MQRPLQHCSFAPHTAQPAPHAWFVVGATQRPLQHSSPVPHTAQPAPQAALVLAVTHFPPQQLCPFGQAAQPPQCRFELVSTQAPPQHALFAPQRVPQLLQWFKSVFVFTHVPPQQV